jgi:hypothetical protein
MRGRLVIAVVMLFIVGAARAQTRGAVDWIFLVDTSKSMRGVGAGNKDIFGDVQASIETFVREASDGDSVSVYTFDRDVRSHGLRDIRGQFDRDELFDTIRGLEANGKRTHLGAAIAKGLERSESLQLRNDPTRTRAIVLFTDGKEDVRGIDNPVSIPSNIDRALKSGSRMFFVSLGEHEHEVQLDAFPNATVLKAHDRDAIRRIAQEIRQKIVEEKPPPPPPPPPMKAEVAPPPPEPLPPPSPFIRFAKWIGAIAALLLLAAIALVIYTGKMPRELLASIAERDTLEGELEIVKPRVAVEAAFVGLPNMRAKELALSAIVPLDALAGNDARLFVRRKSGEKKVWIAAQEGTLRVNDVELPMAELFDADTIRIGDATLRFNRLGHQRPSAQEELA